MSGTREYKTRQRREDSAFVAEVESPKAADLEATDELLDEIDELLSEVENLSDEVYDDQLDEIIEQEYAAMLKAWAANQAKVSCDTCPCGFPLGQCYRRIME